MKRRLTTVFVGVTAMFAAGLCGCASQAGPTLAGGKPVSYWVKALEDSDARVRKKAVDKLGNVGNADPQAFPAVLTALKDKDAAVREAAVVALPKFGDRARESLTALAEVEADDPDDGVRAKAAATVQSIKK